MSASAPLDHLVLGADLGGLCYAWRRMREGKRVLVVPAEKPGEADTTAVVGGFRFDLRHEISLGDTPHLEALLAALPGAPRLHVSDGPPLVAMPSGRLRPLPRAPRRIQMLGRRPYVAETLDLLVLRAQGPAALREVARPLAQATHGTSPTLLGGAETAPALVVAQARGRSAGDLRRVRVRALAGGLSALVDALVAALGDCVVEPCGSPRIETRDGWIHAHADGRVFQAREAVLAGPAEVQAALLETVAAQAAETLSALPRRSVMSAAFAAPGAALPCCPAFLFPSQKARVATALLTSRVAAERAPEGSGLVQVRMAPGSTDDLLERIVEAELTPYLGRLGLRLLGRRTLDVPAPPPGQRGRLAALHADLAPRGLRLLGPHVLGEGIEAHAAAAVPVP